MMKFANAFNPDRFLLISILAAVCLTLAGCGGPAEQPKIEKDNWPNSEKVAGKSDGLSRVSGIAIFDDAIFLTMGGTIADKMDGTNGVRRIDLKTKEITKIDDGEKFPQTDAGALIRDDKFIYWNAGGAMQRYAVDGSVRDEIVTSNIGLGAYKVLANGRIYWVNHGYYAPDETVRPSDIFSVPVEGGKPEIFVAKQLLAANAASDGEFLYWTSKAGIVRKPLKGGGISIVLKAAENDGFDHLIVSGGRLYFSHRAGDNSNWQLRSIGIEGGEPATLVENAAKLPFIADDENLYYFANEGMGLYSLYRISMSGGEPVKMDTGYTNGEIALSATHVYVVTLDDIFRIEKNK
ncbi:MAG: hypothetical protein KF881_12865 [Acidobacteria bacterium]|nr:hypothetical protein [Acidobacteriota bacterium]